MPVEHEFINHRTSFYVDKRDGSVSGCSYLETDACLHGHFIVMVEGKIVAEDVFINDKPVYDNVPSLMSEEERTFFAIQHNIVYVDVASNDLYTKYIAEDCDFPEEQE